jgi:hypothetical protein
MDDNPKGNVLKSLFSQTWNEYAYVDKLRVPHKTFLNLGFNI